MTRPPEKLIRILRLQAEVFRHTAEFPTGAVTAEHCDWMAQLLGEAADAIERATPPTTGGR